MTLSSETVKVQYSGNGSTTAFGITFAFWDADDLRVIHRSAAGVETVWTRGTQYTITGGDGATGTLTAVTSPTDYTPASDTTLTIKSALADTQPTDLPLGGSFPSSSVEQQLDKTVRLVQQKDERLDRAILLQETSTKSAITIEDPVSGQFLRWNADEDGIESGSITASGNIGIPVSIANGGTNATTAAAARTSLGALPAVGGTMTGALAMSGAAINEAHGADIASSGSINLTTATGNLLDVTGTTTITAITLAEGYERTVRFTGALTLTNGASLMLPGAANITTAAGDFAIFRGYAAGVVRCVSYARASGAPVVDASKLRQYASSLVSTYDTTATTVPFDNTIPQSGEGKEITSLAFTPQSAASTLKITLVGFVTANAVGAASIALFKDAGADALAAGSVYVTDSNYVEHVMLVYYESAASTSSRTYKMRYGHVSGTAAINGKSAGAIFNGVMKAGIIVEELV